MRAVVVREHGDLDKLCIEERPDPQPGPGEVRVRVEAVGLNHLDTWVRRGVPGHRFPLPLVCSSDASGRVDALGPGVTQFASGDPVIVLPGVSCGACVACQSGQDQLCPEYQILGEGRDGTCAELVCLPVANLALRPEGLDAVQAASFALAFQTAWSMLQRAGLRAGEWLLVQGAGSGVGSAAVQMGRLLGARVIATAGGAEKCQKAESLGAEVAIDYRQQDFVQELRRLRGRAGVDVVFEHVGAATFDASVACLARGGRLVTCGATTGGQVELSLHRLFFKNLSLIGNTMGSKGDLRRLIEMVGAGQLQTLVDTTLPMDEVREAHRRLQEREVFGKLVLVP